jgi:hypothetical protein
MVLLLTNFLGESLPKMVLYILTSGLFIVLPVFPGKNGNLGKNFLEQCRDTIARL